MLRPDPRPPPVGVERDQDHGPPVALGQPRGDDPDDARVPALAGDAPAPAPRGPRRAARAAPPRPPASTSRLGVAALAVGAVELGGDLGRAVVVVAQHQLDAGVGAVEAPGGVDPRREAEREVSLVEPRRLDPGGGHQRAQPGPPRAPRLGRGPRRTRARFSPVSGTRSATVASATRSRSRSSSTRRRRRPARAARRRACRRPRWRRGRRTDSRERAGARSGSREARRRARGGR